VHTSEFGALPFTQKFVYFWIAITSSRFKYYFAWYFGEAGCVATGFGFNGVRKNKEGAVVGYKFDRVSNCDVLAVESAPHMTDVTNNWNMGVNNWLKNYVYFRVEVSAGTNASAAGGACCGAGTSLLCVYVALTSYCPSLLLLCIQAPRFVVKAGLPQKSFMNLVTKVTSAFWHGFYPSYYVFFIGAWLAGEMDEALRASFEPPTTPEAKKARAQKWWKGPTNAYELLSWACCMTVLNFWGVTFVLLRADHAWQFAKNMHFLGVVLPVVVVLLCRTVFRRKRAKKEQPAAITVPGVTPASPTPSGSPPAQIVNAAVISSSSPLAPLPQHDVLPPVAAAASASTTRVTRKSSRAETSASPPVMVEAEDAAEEAASPAERVKSRPRRSRSNKAD
jgi:lysophospholipid acyltransferase